MKHILPYAKAWVGGVGAAITAYAGTWTDDIRVLGIFSIVAAIATYLVPNGAPPPPPDLRQPNFD